MIFMPENISALDTLQKRQNPLGGGIRFGKDSVRSYLRGYHFCREFACGVGGIRTWKTEEERRTRVSVQTDGQHSRASSRPCCGNLQTRRLQGLQNQRPEAAGYPQSKRPRPAPPPRAVSSALPILRPHLDCRLVLMPERKGDAPRNESIPRVRIQSLA